MHRIIVDRVHKVMELRFTGEGTAEAIGRAGADARKTVQSFGVGPGVHASIYDLSEMVSASEDAIDRAFAEWGDPRFSCVRARKVALIVPGAFARLKLDRLGASRSDLKLFPDRAQAMRWLMA